VSAVAGLTTPDTLEFSVYHEINDQWAVHGDVMWTGWSDFQTLTADYGGAVPLINNRENWEDSMRFAVGATYTHNDRLTFRCGVAYDESPVPDSAHKTLRIPDGDRIWGSIGASYQLNPCYRIDLGYTHIFDTDSSINEPAAGNGVFTGTASGDVELVAIGVSGTF
jgi:long-chain fatty acid transport protein